MNKGIIMEVKQNYAIIMNDDGHMDKISKKKNMAIGQKIFYFEEDIIRTNNIRNIRSNSFMKTIGSIAALFLIAFTFFYQLSYKEAAYAVVSLDINPSIQIEVDNNKTILKVEGMNDDGKNINFKELKENRDVLVAFALVNEDENTDYEESVFGTIKSTFKSEKVTYVKGKKEDVEEAKSAGISLGRYEVLQVADEDAKKEIDKAPVKEITELIKDKENVIQWGDDEDSEKVKVPGSEVVDKVENNTANTDNNSNNTNGSNNNNDGIKKPVINGAVDSSSNANTNNNNNNNNSGTQKPEDDIIIEVPPENKVPEETVPPNKEETIPEKEPAKPSWNDNPSDNEDNSNDSGNDNKNQENDKLPVQGETK